MLGRHSLCRQRSSGLRWKTGKTKWESWPAVKFKSIAEANPVVTMSVNRAGAAIKGTRSCRACRGYKEKRTERDKPGRVWIRFRDRWCGASAVCLFWDRKKKKNKTSRNQASLVSFNNTTFRVPTWKILPVLILRFHSRRRIPRDESRNIIKVLFATLGNSICLNDDFGRRLLSENYGRNIYYYVCWTNY